MPAPVLTSSAQRRASSRRWLPASSRFVALTGAAMLAVAPEASAQLVQGRVRDAVSGAPLDGAVVTLVPVPAGEESSVFSDSAGGYRVRARHAGLHRLHVKRIGYSPFASDTVTVDPSTLVTLPEVALAPRPQTVATVDVTTNQQCRSDPAGGKGAVGLWEDVRTALEATVMTALERKYVLGYTSYDRRLDRQLRELDRQSRTQTVRGTVLITSVPADQLARDGYVVSTPQGVMYRGLDARVLLSDSFLQSHCFGAAPRRPASDSLVGLAFEPVGRDRDRVDVRGVLWLNRKSGELDAIDFTYVGLDFTFSTRDLGGRVEFEQLPSGRWIVNRWWIRMPRIEQKNPTGGLGSAGMRPTQTLLGFNETGGEVSTISGPDGAARPRPPEPDARRRRSR